MAHMQALIVQTLNTTKLENSNHNCNEHDTIIAKIFPWEPGEISKGEVYIRQLKIVISFTDFFQVGKTNKLVYNSISCILLSW